MDAIALSTLPIMPLIQRHANDAAFYWNQRDESITSSHLQLERLSHFDSVLQANLEGLIAAGDAGWDTALQAMERWKGVSQLFVCAFIALQDKSAERLPLLCKRIEAQPNYLARGLISALAWHHQHSNTSAPNWINHWLETATNPLLRTIALRAAGCTGIACHTQALNDCTAESPYQRAAACRALGAPVNNNENEVLNSTIQQSLANCLNDAAANVRAEAAISLLNRSQSQSALNVLRGTVLLLAQQIPSLKGSQIKVAQRKLERWITQLAIHCPIGDTQAGILLEQLSPQEQILFVATHGDPVFIPHVLNWAEETNLAPGVLWAISLITGVDTHAAGIESDTDIQPSSTISKFKTMPIPNVPALCEWWLAQQRLYVNGQRLLLGQVLPPNNNEFNKIFHDYFLYASQTIRYLVSQHHNKYNSDKRANVRDSISVQSMFIQGA